MSITHNRLLEDACTFLACIFRTIDSTQEKVGTFFVGNFSSFKITSGHFSPRINREQDISENIKTVQISLSKKTSRGVHFLVCISQTVSCKWKKVRTCFVENFSSFKISYDHFSRKRHSIGDTGINLKPIKWGVSDWWIHDVYWFKKLILIH